jgi:copper chaperone CopZ
VDDEVAPGAGLLSPGMGASGRGGIELRHAIPGRVRLRFPGIKGEPTLAREIERQLAGLTVVRRVEVSPVTGSVLVVYDPADSAAIAELGRMIIPGLDLDGLSAPEGVGPAAGAETSSPAAAVADFARQLNAKVEAATGGADLRFLVPASLFVGGLVRLIVSKKLTSPAWYDFLWFAFGTYCTLNQGPATGESAAPGAGRRSRSKGQDKAIPRRTADNGQRG